MALPGMLLEFLGTVARNIYLVQAIGSGARRADAFGVSFPRDAGLTAEAGEVGEVDQRAADRLGDGYSRTE
jgi:hypothetical protein